MMPDLMPACEDDQVLFQRVQRGDRAAFDELYRRYEPRLRTYLRRAFQDSDDPDADAQEFAHDALLKAWLHAPRARPDSQVQAWLYRITQNVMRDEKRHRKTVTWERWADRDRGPRHGLLLAPRDERPDEAQEDAERAQAVQAVLASLPRKYRAYLFLQQYSERSYDEIAEAFGSTRERVKMTLYRARKRFLAAWEARGEDVPPAPRPRGRPRPDLRIAPAVAARVAARKGERGVTQRALARQFGVHRATVQRIWAEA